MDNVNFNKYSNKDLAFVLQSLAKYSVGDNNIIYEALSRIILDLRELNNWIDVKKELPPLLKTGQYARYIVATSSWVGEAYWLDKKWCTSMDGCSYIKPLYWRSFPKPPNIKKEKKND